MIGAVLIILSYVLIPQIRTKTREILVHLSLMDFMAAAGNFVGVVVNFDHYLGNDTDAGISEETYRTAKKLCITQASFAIYGTEASVLWTICMAMYIYLRIMYDSRKTAKQACYFFYVICYGIPLICTLWFALTGKLGYSRDGGSGWCSVILTEKDGRFRAIISNDIFIYITIFIVPLIFISLHFYLKSELPSLYVSVGVLRPKIP